MTAIAALALGGCAADDPTRDPEVRTTSASLSSNRCTTACAPRPHPEKWDPSQYRTCCDADPCPGEAACVEGLCVARCNGGAACVEGDVCWDAGCQNKCDGKHACAAGYSCVSGKCQYDPCGHPEAFPLSKSSTKHPIIVHYRDEAEACNAGEVLDALDDSWDTQTSGLGFTPPRSDNGLCGPDAAFDSFVWRTYRAAVGDVVAPDPTTWWDDYSGYLIVDPWGPYGGDYLRATVAHEFNHTIQAAYDWWDSDIVFEMTSQFVEGMVPAKNSFAELLFEYQAKPDYSFDYDDHWDGWYMYGSALYLAYLRDGVFGGDPRFVSEMWYRSRNPPGKNEPDFEDALDSILRERAGMTFQDSVKQFDRWRWYTSTRDDGKHFKDGASFPTSSLVKIERQVRMAPQTLDMTGPMQLGAQYIQIHREPGDPAQAIVRFTGDKRLGWSLQAVPGITSGSDGETLDVSSGQATVSFGDLTDRTIIVLALPDASTDDPDGRTDRRYAYSLSIAPVTP